MVTPPPPLPHLQRQVQHPPLLLLGDAVPGQGEHRGHLAGEGPHYLGEEEEECNHQ